jgi:flagellar hook-length control protein FliK
MTGSVSAAPPPASADSPAPSAGGVDGNPDQSSGPPFTTVLDDHVARTAVAEGQHKSAGGSGSQSDQPTPAATDVASAAAAQAAPAVAHTPPSAQAQTASATVDGSAGTAVTQPATPAQAPSTAPEETSTTTATPTTPTTQAPAAQPASAAKPAPTAPQPSTAGATPQPTPTRAPASAHQNSTGAPAPAPTAATAPAPDAAQTAVVQTPQSAQPSQAAPAAPATALPMRSGVTLSDAVDTVRATVEMGARQGATIAKIELSPPSLGTISIQLQHTDDGVTAKVLADHAATADTLSQGGDDLRRALQSAGVNLLSLDIGTRGDSAQAQTSDPGPSSGSTYAVSGDGSDTAGDAGAIEPATSLPAGIALVNVLA